MANVDSEQPAPGWRIKVGFVLFIVGLIGIPLLIAILALIGGTRFAAISVGLAVTGEVMLVAGAAIAGKQGYAYIKSTVFGFLKQYGPPKKVSRTRYTIGLVMFVLPLLLGWAGFYFGGRIPGFEENIIIYAISGDVLLVVSLFVLGGDFWEKLRSLFIHRAYAVIPDKPST